MKRVSFNQSYGSLFVVPITRKNKNKKIKIKQKTKRKRGKGKVPSSRRRDDSGVKGRERPGRKAAIPVKKAYESALPSICKPYKPLYVSDSDLPPLKSPFSLLNLR